MKYKIENNCKLFDDIQKLQVKMQFAFDASKKLVEEVGATKWQPEGELAGGITGFVLDNKPLNWRYSYWSKEAFFPKKIKSNQELISKIESLPIVKKSELASLLNYGVQTFYNGSNDVISFVPDVRIRDEIILVAVNENATYVPVEGMIEILESEYRELLMKHNSHQYI